MFSYCVLSTSPPTHTHNVWSVCIFFAFRIGAAQGGGQALCSGEPWSSQRLWAGRAEGWEEEAGAGWLGLGPPARAPVSLFCFVHSGPRLRPWQKESRKPTKVSPPASRMGSLDSSWGWMRRPSSFFYRL